jgi:hypothetical protein
MDGMTGGDWVLLSIAAYVAVLSLVRLMLGYRRQVIARLNREVAEEQRRQHEAEHQKATNR